ncbi:hypothetical protein AMTRI_Chr03g49390 [Amborella trichopoda]
MLEYFAALPPLEDHSWMTKDLSSSSSIANLFPQRLLLIKYSGHNPHQGVGGGVQAFVWFEIRNCKGCLHPSFHLLYLPQKKECLSTQREGCQSLNFLLAVRTFCIEHPACGLPYTCSS